jgi:hypothetical protein
MFSHGTSVASLSHINLPCSHPRYDGYDRFSPGGGKGTEGTESKEGTESEKSEGKNSSKEREFHPGQLFRSQSGLFESVFGETGSAGGGSTCADGEGAGAGVVHLLEEASKVDAFPGKLGRHRSFLLKHREGTVADAAPPGAVATSGDDAMVGGAGVGDGDGETEQGSGLREGKAGAESTTSTLPAQAATTNATGATGAMGREQQEYASDDFLSMVIERQRGWPGWLDVEVVGWLHAVADALLEKREGGGGGGDEDGGEGGEGGGNGGSEGNAEDRRRQSGEARDGVSRLAVGDIQCGAAHALLASRSATLRSIPLCHLVLRFLLLRHFNDRMRWLLYLVDMENTGDGMVSLAGRVALSRALLFRDVKLSILQRILTATATGDELNRPTVSISRASAQRAQAAAHDGQPGGSAAAAAASAGSSSGGGEGDGGVGGVADVAGSGGGGGGGGGDAGGGGRTAFEQLFWQLRAVSGVSLRQKVPDDHSTHMSFEAVFVNEEAHGTAGYVERAEGGRRGRRGRSGREEEKRGEEERRGEKRTESERRDRERNEMKSMYRPFLLLLE